MRYVKSRFIQDAREETYRIYITDSLKAFGGFDLRYADLDKKMDFYGVKEERSSEEIIASISGKIAALGGD